MGGLIMMDIEKSLAAFTFTLGQMQDIIVLITHLETNNISFSEFITYVDEKKVEKAKEVKQLKSQFKECKLCKHPMILMKVNTEPRNQTGDDSTKVYTCTNQECMNQIFES